MNRNSNFSFKSCCKCSIFKCCDHGTSQALRIPHHLIKILIIIIITLSLGSTEAVLIYLDSKNVLWGQETLPKFYLYRIVSWLSLATTLIILIGLVKKWKKNLKDNLSNLACIVCRGSEKTLKSLTCMSTCRRKMINWEFADLVQSFLFSGAYLLCALCMLNDIPVVYEHHVQVGLKVFEFLIDLFLALLFAKSCMSAYAQYGEVAACHCDETIYERERNITDSFVSSSGSFAEEKENKVLLKTVNGTQYTRLPS